MIQHFYPKATPFLAIYHTGGVSSSVSGLIYYSSWCYVVICIFLHYISIKYALLYEGELLKCDWFEGWRNYMEARSVVCLEGKNFPPFRVQIPLKFPPPHSLYFTPSRTAVAILLLDFCSVNNNSISRKFLSLLPLNVFSFFF